MEAVVTDVLESPVCWAPGDQAEILPQSHLAGKCEGCPLRVEVLDLRQQRGYYKAIHQRACQRENELKRKVEELEAKLRLRERQLFGCKSEKSTSDDSPRNKQTTSRPPKRLRRQQPGSTGHGRKDHSHLEPIPELWDRLSSLSLTGWKAGPTEVMG